MKPQFTPMGGVGSTWKDSGTGQAYRFTDQGWVEESGDIKKEVAKEGAFEIKPDEKNIVETLKTGGSSQEQINQGLAERRRVLSNLGKTEGIEREGEVPWDDYLSKTEELVGRGLTGAETNELRQQYNENIVKSPAPTKDKTHPFGGMSRRALLRDAFKKGVTSPTELKKLNTLYDLLVGEDEDDENEDFTETEKRKLEQAGLLYATRQEKLDFLYE